MGGFVVSCEYLQLPHMLVVQIDISYQNAPDDLTVNIRKL